MKRKVIKIPTKSVLQYLQLFNGIFELTTKELEVLAAFVELHLRLKASGVQANAFSSDMKKNVAESLGMDDFNHLNVYIKQLVGKKAIWRTAGGYAINPWLLHSGEEEIVFRIK